MWMHYTRITMEIYLDRWLAGWLTWLDFLLLCLLRLPRFPNKSKLHLLHTPPSHTACCMWNKLCRNMSQRFFGSGGWFWGFFRRRFRSSWAALVWIGGSFELFCFIYIWLVVDSWWIIISKVEPQRHRNERSRRRRRRRCWSRSFRLQVPQVHTPAIYT